MKVFVMKTNWQIIQICLEVRIHEVELGSGYYKKSLKKCMLKCKMGRSSW